MRVGLVPRVLFLVIAAAIVAGCSQLKDATSPTSPTPPDPSKVTYTAIGASDAAGVGSSVVCVPFTQCDNGTGWVQGLFRRIQQASSSATLLNLGVPGAVLSEHIEDLGRRVGRTYPGNFISNQAPFTSRDSTIVTVFAGGNDANTIGQVVKDGLAGDDVRAFVDQQVRQWGDDYGALLQRIRQRAPTTKIVLLNLPNLAGAPYMARSSTFERSVMQRIAVGLSERVNALASSNVFVVDLLCDARILEPASYSSDGFHPSDRGYSLMAELAHGAVAASAYPAPASDCPQRRVVPVF